jgi:membrane protein involved in colicin uptake
MLDEDKRLADAQAAAEAEQRRLAAETERQRQAYDAAVKADAGAMAQAAAALKSADDARLAAENALQVARSRQASIGNLPGTWTVQLIITAAAIRSHARHLKTCMKKRSVRGVFLLPPAR